jgi:hypothetical protein
LIKDDNEPTQIFGGVKLPPPYMSTSIVNPNPVDVVRNTETSTSSPTASNTPTLTSSGSTVSETMTAESVGSVGTSTMPTASGGTIVAEPVFPIRTIKAELATIQPDMGNAIPIVEDITFWNVEIVFLSLILIKRVLIQIFGLMVMTTILKLQAL